LAGTLLSTSLLAGVPVHVVSKRLGHASPVVTMTTYANSRELHQTGEKPQVA
jgi:integrase